MVLVSGKLYQIIAVVTGTLTVISDGINFGWSSPIVPLLQSSESRIKLENSDIVWLENYVMFGGFAGLALSFVLIDKLGRKKTMLLAAVENLVAWILIATATSTTTIFLARFIGGIASDVNFVAAPIYIAEISEKRIRGRLGSLINVLCLFGVVLIYCIGPFLTITASSLVPICILIIQLLTFSLMPESPYYLLMKNKHEEAHKSLQTFRDGYVDEELQELSEIVDKENATRGRLLDLFTVKNNRKAILIMSVLNVSQNFTGLTVMIMNLHLILEEAGSTFAANSAAIIFASLMLLACIYSTFLVDLAGRRVLLYTSSFLTAICLFVLGTYFLLKQSGVDTSECTWIPVAATLLYALALKTGLAFIPIIVTAELFPTNVKAFGCTVADGIYILSSTISVSLFHFLYRSFGMYLPFYIFGFCAVLTGLFAIYILPETKGKTLEEIQEILKGSECENSETTRILSTNGKEPELVLNSRIEALSPQVGLMDGFDGIPAQNAY